MVDGRANWAGNFIYSAVRAHVPGSVEEVCSLVRGAAKVRAVGTRHSFNAIADTEGEQVSLERMARVVALDDSRRCVTVEAGIRYGDLAAWLHARGWALQNLASLPHISVAGAVATATHGSGTRNGCLATAVVGMEMVMADGTVREFSRETDGEIFEGIVVALGALGIVTKLTLRIQETFELRQFVYEGLPLEEACTHFDEIMKSGYSVSLFTDWRGETINQIWAKQHFPFDPPLPRDWYGARAAESARHPIGGISAEHCTAQMGEAGPWHERLPHFRMDFTPSSGEELQSEYFVHRVYAAEAMRAVAALGEQLSPVLLISEIRSIAADQLWMSPFYQRDSVAFHFTWKPEWGAVREVLPAIEAALEPFGVRPHWGKLFTLSAGRLRREYRRLADFAALARELDPAGKFGNAAVNAWIFDST